MTTMDMQQDAHSLLKALAKPDSFSITVELCSGQKQSTQKDAQLLNKGIRLSNDKRVQAIAVGDCLQGLSMGDFSVKLQESGIEPILYYSLQGKNRDTVVHDLQQFQNRALKNIVIVGGDYPAPSPHKSDYPLFDLDSVQALMLMNGGAEPVQFHENPAFGPESFYCGCVVSPFKTIKQERIGQYVKLARKVRAGARFIVTQIGYNITGLEYLKQFCHTQGLHIPILVNLFLPSPKLARQMYKGMIPGVTLSPEEAQEFSADNGDKTDNSTKNIMAAAKRIAVIRGLGFSGVHLGGPGLHAHTLSTLLDQAEAFSSGWEQYYDEMRANKPLQSNQQKPKRAVSGQAETSASSHRHLRLQYPLYSFSWLIDWTAFVPGGLLFPFMKRLCRYAAGKSVMTILLYWMEKASKVPLYNCRMCGDCTLYSSSFICMEATCPKNQLNGPCGGSINGFCEVYPEKRLCRWVVAYQQCPDDSLEFLCKEPSLQPKGRQLDNTSSWINFFTGKDHRKMDKD